MKKVLTVLMGVAVGFAARAAQVDWYAYSDLLPDGATAYVFGDGGLATTMASYLTSGDYEDSSAFTTAIASYSGSAVDGGYADGLLTGVESDGYASILVVGNFAEGSMVYTQSNIALDGYTYAPPESSPDMLAFDTFTSSEIKYKDAPVPPTPIPEPTSGLLMLLGMAGLALRRRRA